MGRPRPKSKQQPPRFTQSEVEQLEKLFPEADNESLNQNFYQKLTEKLNLGSGRVGKTFIHWKQVESWFQSRQQQAHTKVPSSPTLSKEAAVRPVDCISDDAPESSSDTPKGDKVTDASDLEFEARSSKDGAWYDVATFLTHRKLDSGEYEARVRFVGFGAEEDEWVNIKKAVRKRSVPLEPSECQDVKAGDLVLCFRERKDHASYFDAHVVEIQRRLHDIRGCRCIFLVRYDHDHVEEKVFMRRICRRPSNDPSGNALLHLFLHLSGDENCIAL